MPFDTVPEAVTEIRERLIAAEKALERLHEALLKGWRKHGDKLVPPDQIEPLAGGGQPKEPPRP